MLCPCDSGMDFVVCHGKVDGVIAHDPRVPKPLFIVGTPTPDGRSYKVVGANESQVREEGRKAYLWLKK